MLCIRNIRLKFLKNGLARLKVFFFCFFPGFSILFNRRNAERFGGERGVG